MLSNAQEVVAEARHKGVVIIHCPITFTDDYRELRADAYGILAKWVQCNPGTTAVCNAALRFAAPNCSLLLEVPGHVVWRAEGVVLLTDTLQHQEQRLRH